MSSNPKPAKKKKIKSSSKESSVVEKKKTGGLKGLEDNPETRQFALDKLGDKATGWYGYASGSNTFFKGPAGQSARGIGNAEKQLKASLAGEVVVKKTGLKV